MNYTAEVKDLPRCIVYYKQGTVTSFADIGDFILRSAEECRKANPEICCTETDYCYTAYLDPDFTETDIFLEYGQAVTAAGVETEQIKFKTLEQVPAVCVRHNGSYDTIRNAYLFAFAWAAEHGYDVAAPPREQYIHGVWDSETPDEWVTEIQIPIKKS